MKLEALAKSQLAVLKNGFLLAAILAIVFYLFYRIWGFMLSLGYNYFSVPLVNFGLKIVVFSVTAYFVGLVFEINLFKKIVFRFLKVLPLAGYLIEFLNHLERIKKEGLPEVMFELLPGSGVWLKGWVSKEWRDEKIGKIICGVVLPMFVHAIGAYTCVEKDKLIYTKRSAVENITECISGGLISRK